MTGQYDPDRSFFMLEGYHVTREREPEMNKPHASRATTPTDGGTDTQILKDIVAIKSVSRCSGCDLKKAGRRQRCGRRNGQTTQVCLVRDWNRWSRFEL